MIHLILLSTNKFNWLDGAKKPAAASAQNAPMPAATPRSWTGDGAQALRLDIGFQCSAW